MMVSLIFKLILFCVLFTGFPFQYIFSLILLGILSQFSNLQTISSSAGSCSSTYPTLISASTFSNTTCMEFLYINIDNEIQRERYDCFYYRNMGLLLSIRRELWDFWWYLGFYSIIFR